MARQANWGNPNRKSAKRLKARIASYEAICSKEGIGPEDGYHRPGSNKK